MRRLALQIAAVAAMLTPGVAHATTVGLNEAGWGPAAATDVATTFGTVRVDTDRNEPVSDFTTAGLNLDVLFPGPYTTGGVKALSNNWASNALAWYQAYCNPVDCPMIEVLNEPAGTWFWGANAGSSANASAYAKLLRKVRSTFQGAYGNSRPLILASFDGGRSDSTAWGQAVSAADPTVWSQVDGVTVHPYGGTVDRAQSALGNRANAASAHQLSGRPVYVTEVGWPTAVGQPATGDSLQWTEAEQAANVYGFIGWAQGTGYVPLVTFFGYRDYGTNTWYGLERWGEPGTVDGSRKPAWDAAAQAIAGVPCTVCG